VTYASKMTESLDTTKPSSDSVASELPDAAWELPELAVVAILVSIGLLALAGAMQGIFLNGRLLGFRSDELWVGVEYAARWVNATTAAVLLGALGICWWQYGQWTTASHRSDDVAVVAHVRRLKTLTWWLRIAFVLVVVASVAVAVASIVVSTWQPSLLSSEWTNGIQAILIALATDVVALVGYIASSRVFNASAVHLERFDPSFANDIGS
jgi:hypothetical protein